jgi:HD-like signal output (HDOD) protein
MLLPQLMRAVNDTETTRRELANIISRDPALAGSLLRLANSPFYRINAQPVESIDRAVAILGTEGIRSLIASAVMQPVFRVAGGEFTRFPETIWEHTFRAGAAAEAHAAIIENSDPFAAQLLGMLMGLGSIVVFRAALDQYTAHPTVTPDAGVIASLLNSHSAQVAGRIATSWDLSGRILSALEDQYAPMHEPTALGRSLRFGRLMGALAVLEANEALTDDVAKSTMLATGASGPQVERIWSRLTGKPAAPERQPAARARPFR